MIELPEKLTIGEAFDPAMKITDQKEADEYFEALVTRSMKYHHQNRKEAERIQRENLGYYAGYYDKETRKRVERLFKCSHPIFGPVSNGIPTPEEVFEMGKKFAETNRK